MGSYHKPDDGQPCYGNKQYDRDFEHIETKIIKIPGDFRLRGFYKTVVNYLTAFFNKAPALNLGALEAGILISLPVAGLRPLRAERLATENVPKPVN